VSGVSIEFILLFATITGEDVIKSLGEIGAMNAERLHLILKLASEAFGSSKISKSLRLLRDALQNQVNEPSNANHQQQVSSNLADLRNKLSALATNDFPPPWKQTLREVKLANLIGSDMLLSFHPVAIRASTVSVTP
jgi:hypothetical protein